MAVHGYKVDNKEFQKVIDNVLARQVRKAASAGKKAMKDISRDAITEFYKDGKPGHSYSSMQYATRVYANNPKQNKDMVWIDIDMEVDEEVFLSNTSGYYSIYEWADKHNKSSMAAAEMVIGRQWKRGIIGLPDPYSNYTTTPLHDIMKLRLENEWDDKVSNYL